MLSATTSNGTIFSMPNRREAPSSGSWPRYESEMMRIVPALSSKLQALQITSAAKVKPIERPRFSWKSASTSNGLLLNRRFR